MLNYERSKHVGLNMTVQELIDALNKVKDKSKPILFDYIIDIEGIEEGVCCVEIY